MSRIGKRQLNIPSGVTCEVTNKTLTVKGPKGTLELVIDPLINVVIEENIIKTDMVKDITRANVMQGTTNSLISNMLTGVSDGYVKGLETVGVGYKFAVSGNKLTVNAGYSHPVEMIVPEGLTVVSINNTEIEVQGIDKQKVTEFAANIRKVRRPEPYKGKGIHYKGERIRRKEGKKAA